MTCPAQWTPRSTGYIADGYKPRTRAHVVTTPRRDEDAA